MQTDKSAILERSSESTVPRAPFEISARRESPEDGGNFARIFDGLPCSLHSVPAKRRILHTREHAEHVPVLCDGWATAQIVMADGRRQILSILLPGDVASLGLLVDSSASYSVEAVTAVRYRAYKRTDLQQLLVDNADAAEEILKLWAEHNDQNHQLIVDLGQRSAAERIARLVLRLMGRLTRRGLARGQTIPFPLRQRHIADATGLTPVHVSHVLTRFRRQRLIEIADRSLTILDPPELNRIGMSK